MKVLDKVVKFILDIKKSSINKARGRFDRFLKEVIEVKMKKEKTVA